MCSLTGLCTAYIARAIYSNLFSCLFRIRVDDGVVVAAFAAACLLAHFDSFLSNFLRSSSTFQVDCIYINSEKDAYQAIVVTTVYSKIGINNRRYQEEKN